MSVNKRLPRLTVIGRTEITMGFITTGNGLVAALSIDGPARDAALVGAANGLDTAVLAKVPAGFAAEHIERTYESSGITAVTLQDCEALLPAACLADNVVVRQSRGSPFVHSDLSKRVFDVACGTSVLIFMAEESAPSTPQFVGATADAAWGAFRVLVPSAGLVASPSFSQLGSAFELVLAGPEASQTGYLSDDALRSALRLRRLLGDDTPCGVLGLDEGGWLWTGTRWVAVPTLPSLPIDLARRVAVFATALGIAIESGRSVEDAVAVAHQATVLMMNRSQDPANQPPR